MVELDKNRKKKLTKKDLAKMENIKSNLVQLSKRGKNFIKTNLVQLSKKGKKNKNFIYYISNWLEKW